jgi:hypothetical protein
VDLQQALNAEALQYAADTLLEARDVRLVLADVRAQVLRGCRLVFSHCWPRDQPAYNQPLWRLAEALGAECSSVYTPDRTTHLVASHPGTNKVSWQCGWYPATCFRSKTIGSKANHDVAGWHARLPRRQCRQLRTASLWWHPHGCLPVNLHGNVCPSWRTQRHGHHRCRLALAVAAPLVEWWPHLHKQTCRRR